MNEQRIASVHECLLTPWRRDRPAVGRRRVCWLALLLTSALLLPGDQGALADRGAAATQQHCPTRELVLPTSGAQQQPTPTPVSRPNQLPPAPAEAPLRGLVIDFVAAIFANEDKARNYLAPDSPLAIPQLRQELDLHCAPDTFGVQSSQMQGGAATVTVVLHYPTRTVLLQVWLVQQGQRWLITQVAGTQAAATPPLHLAAICLVNRHQP